MFQALRPADDRTENKEQRTKNKEQRTKNKEQRTNGLRTHGLRTTDYGLRTTDIFRIAWLYPLARLYSLGPWNAGWSFATVLLGGTMALWWAGSSLTRSEARAQALPMPLSYLALALAGLGLSSSAGIAAGCYAILAYLVILAGGGDGAMKRQDDGAAPLSPSPFTPSPLHWLLSGAIPLTAPFVATWMLVGAGLAGGVGLLSGAAWLVALFHALASALRSDRIPAIARRPLLVAATASVALGVGAPLVVRTLIEPVIEQLQGGLTPYGDVNIWPWVGLAASDSAHTQVTTLPSIAVALLMLVLSALVYLVARLRAADTRFPDREAAAASASIEHEGTRGKMATLMRDLRGEVPWLGALFSSGQKARSGGLTASELLVLVGRAWSRLLLYPGGLAAFGLAWLIAIAEHHLERWPRITAKAAKVAKKGTFASLQNSLRWLSAVGIPCRCSRGYPIGDKSMGAGAWVEDYGWPCKRLFLVWRSALSSSPG